ncbi:HsdM family class I SAM-dependent methyltransferase [Tenacibaculum sp. IMCC1]
MSQNILQYESKVWSTADLLIGAGIKQSDFPKYMMPYFAMIMLESRLVRHYKELLKDFDAETIKDIENIDDFLEEFKDYNIGYNDLVIRSQKTLAEICRNDKTFDNDFDAYLKAFDPETKELLGVDRGNTEEKYLDISGVSGQLRKKDILFDTVKKWSEIDLTPFNNSDITTLEEHIKRKWADISAETAGEQYTPDDIISLISEIILSKIEDNNEFLTIYDPTCGGGNLLFGVEDRIKEKFNRPTKTYGEDWSDSLYALAKIESRFRNDSDIKYGNTLTKIHFIEKQFDVIVANPPYGVDWKGYRKDIENDTTERFHALPSISDGQFLFTQHILSQLDTKGLSVVVHNGSTLFSGDAGSGESNIRKYFFDNDWVEAIIQMPTDEFFNTGIYTYLWIFNKNKPQERKDKVMLIDGSNFWEPLKKSKGKKRREMVFDNRKTIVDTLTDFKDTEHAKVFDKWYFYFNKQAIMLTNVDENGKTFEDQLPVKKNKQGEEIRAKSIKLNPTKITQVVEEETIELKDFEITSYDTNKYSDLKEYYENNLKPLVASLDYKEADLKVYTTKTSYYFDADKETIIEVSKNEDGSLSEVEMGCGKIVVKASYKKATKTKEARIEISVELTADYEKDYEIIPYSPNEEENQQNIADFMAKYITKPFVYIENTIGVEINFNKVFYKPEQLRSLQEITSHLQKLENKLLMLDKELNL